MGGLKVLLIGFGIALLDLAFAIVALITAYGPGGRAAGLVWLVFLLASLGWVIWHGWRRRRDGQILAHMVAFVIALGGGIFSLYFIGTALAAGV